MFFLKELQHSITLAPECFGPQLHDLLRFQLYQQIEGTCSGRHGYIVAVMSVDDIGRGLIRDDGSAAAAFNIRFKAIVLKPFKNEVMDAIVTTVNKMGFFAEVGPLQVFVSNHLIPNDFKYEPNSVPPCYISEDQGQQLAPGDHVRLKIVGTRIDATEIFAIGTIKEDYLGLIN